MPNLNFTITHQLLTVITLPLAADSVDYLTAEVTFETDDWLGRSVWAHFKQFGKVFDIEVIDGKIAAGQHLHLSAGDWLVYFHGNSPAAGDTIPRITTNTVHISVAPTGILHGEPFASVPPSLGEQIMNEFSPVSALRALTETNTITPVADASNSLYIDNDGKVYTI